jgi:mono/diheme cytochrome c family protein
MGVGATMQYQLPASALLCLMLTSAAAHPAGADDSKGSQLARQWCASCHVTGGGPAGNVQQGPPSFPTIARARTADQLRAFLSHPHGAMPDLSLTRAEIDNLVGYIQTLR